MFGMRSLTERSLVPGELLAEGDHLFIGCGEGGLEVLEVQLEGKKRMAARDFIHGYRPQTGEKLGS